MTDSPWPLLRSVNRFVLRTGPRHDGGESMEGTGEIRVQLVDASHVVWREQGRWRAGALGGGSFWNATQWRAVNDGNEIELSHLRRGDRAATRLVHLRATGARRWESVLPHICDADQYLATLEWDDARLWLTWDVSSPTDPYHLTFEATR